VIKGFLDVGRLLSSLIRSVVVFSVAPKGEMQVRQVIARSDYWLSPASGNQPGGSWAASSFTAVFVRHAAVRHHEPFDERERSRRWQGPHSFSC